MFAEVLLTFQTFRNTEFSEHFVTTYDSVCWSLQDMKTLKDYLAYARAYVNPRISERAGMQSSSVILYVAL